ncbi:MAG: hypothetical protein DRP56_07460 [Planctomycetota bacterium]|nr:MAG: hypothetical protein DRP56_07460 [Planctomycetota bacterium]
MIEVPCVQKVKIVERRTQTPETKNDQTTPETESLEEDVKKKSDSNADSYELQDHRELHDPQPFNNSFQDNQSHNSASGMGSQTINEGDATKTCPHCGGIVLAIAKKCKYCKSFLDSPERMNDALSPAMQQNTRVSDIYIGMCIVVLILSVLVNIISLQLRVQSEGGVSVIILLLNALFLYFDERMLKRNGIPTDELASVWLIPVYLFKRARLTSGSNGYAISWIIIFVISVLIELG